MNVVHRNSNVTPQSHTVVREEQNRYLTFDKDGRQVGAFEVIDRRTSISPAVFPTVFPALGF